MNTAIENLDQWGGQFLDWVLAIFWQSSVLGLVLLGLDFGLRRRLRASVRYGLWLVLLAKLALPPSLALPTSPAWWWSAANYQPVPAPQFQYSKYTVTHNASPLAESLPPLPGPLTTPRPALTLAALSFLLAVGVSLGLFLWLLLRWHGVLRIVRAAAPASLSSLMEGWPAGKIRSSVRVKITCDTMSPAVCGLFRPVILLPQTLVERLAPEQLRAVLLHEQIHVRRGDVWVSLAQALLQIIYWWHPVVWLANARIRRVREEAVDDAVLVALRDDADIYAPTLLAVAKFAFQRPAASLGLVGILESRSALRERIERLVTFPAPRRAGLTLLSVCGLIAFSSVALPMGSGPAADSPAEDPAASSGVVTNTPTATGPATFSSRFGNPYAMTGMVFTGPGRHDIIAKLDHIRLAHVLYDHWPLSQVLGNLSAQVKSLDPQKTGINFVINPNPASPGTAAPPDPGTAVINFNLTDVSVADVLDAIVLVADQPIKYSVQDFGVVFSAKPADAEALYMRTFKIDPDTFSQGLGGVGSATFGAGANGGSSGNPGSASGGTVVPKVNVAPVAGQTPQARTQGATRPPGAPKPFSAKRMDDELSIRARAYFAGLGVDFAPPKAIFYNDRLGLLFVKASKSDLDKIERALGAMRPPASAAPVFPDPNFPEAIRALEARQGVENLGVPKVTVTSGRRTQLQTENQVDRPTQDRGSADSLVADGKVFYEMGNLDEARVKFNRALVIDPGNANAHFYLGLVETAADQSKSVPAANGEKPAFRPQLHIKARFIETDFPLADFPALTNYSDGQIVIGILSPDQARAYIRQFATRPGTATLAQPEVTTSNGRRTQMRATAAIGVVTAYQYETHMPDRSASISAITTNEEFGSIFDVVPRVFADNCTIDLAVTATLREFLGYGEPANSAPVAPPGKAPTLPEIHPLIVDSPMSAHVRLYDNQTLLLYDPLPRYDSGVIDLAHIYPGAGAAPANKYLLVLATVSIVDAAGNLVHTDNQLPSARDHVPPPAPARVYVPNAAPVDDRIEF